MMTPKIYAAEYGVEERQGGYNAHCANRSGKTEEGESASLFSIRARALPRRPEESHQFSGSVSIRNIALAFDA